MTANNTRTDSTADYLAQRSQSADLDAYRRVLARIPDSSTVAGDELSDEDAATQNEP